MLEPNFEKADGLGRNQLVDLNFMLNRTGRFVKMWPFQCSQIANLFISESKFDVKLNKIFQK